MRATVFFCVATVVVLLGIFILLRSLKLKEKYAILWIFVGLACLILVAFPSLLSAVARFVGIQVGSNLLFTLAIFLLLGICLQLSLEISRQEDKVRRLAEETAILRADVEELRQSCVTVPGTLDSLQSKAGEADHSVDMPLTGAESPEET